MSSRDWQLRIQDILKAINSIQKRTEGMSFEQFVENETVIKAVLYDFIVIGEAANNIPTEVKENSSNHTYKVEEFIHELGRRIDHHKMERWCIKGVPCEVLTPNQGWKKGKVKIT